MHKLKIEADLTCTTPDAMALGLKIKEYLTSYPDRVDPTSISVEVRMAVAPEWPFDDVRRVK